MAIEGMGVSGGGETQQKKTEPTKQQVRISKTAFDVVEFAERANLSHKDAEAIKKPLKDMVEELTDVYQNTEKGSEAQKAAIGKIQNKTALVLKTKVPEASDLAFSKILLGEAEKNAKGAPAGLKTAPTELLARMSMFLTPEDAVTFSTKVSKGDNFVEVLIERQILEQDAEKAFLESLQGQIGEQVKFGPGTVIHPEKNIVSKLLEKNSYDVDKVKKLLGAHANEVFEVVTTLDVSDAFDLTDDQLNKMVSAFPNLEILAAVDCFAITGKDFPRHEHLKELHVAGTDFTDEALNQLDLPQLEMLDVSATKISDLELPGVPNLQDIVLLHTTNVHNLDALGSKPQLKSITFAPRESELTSIENLDSHENLRVLNLLDITLNGETLEKLGKLRNLEALSINQNVPVDTLVQLQKLKSLTLATSVVMSFEDIQQIIERVPNLVNFNYGVWEFSREQREILENMIKEKRAKIEQAKLGKAVKEPPSVKGLEEDIDIYT